MGFFSSFRSDSRVLLRGRGIFLFLLACFVDCFDVDVGWRCALRSCLRVLVSVGYCSIAV